MGNKDHQIDGNCSIEISHFDYSVDNYTKSIDSIGELCGLPLNQSFDSCEVERFSSMIKFVKGWKNFVCEPRSIIFQSETSGHMKDAFDGIDIPQFSSAAVPKMEQQSTQANDLCSDCVLHAGGLVWAMDWCPSNFASLDSEFKCEFLAISAHPPVGFTHKIGIPAQGEGIIQIWCLLTRRESAEISSPSRREPCERSRGKHKGAKSKRSSSAEKQTVEIKCERGGECLVNACEDINNRLPENRCTLPKVISCLAHDGKVAWDLKWRPVSIIKSEEKQSLGYLAALLGNGSLMVWEVPLPNIVNRIHTSRGTDVSDPRFMLLQPVFKCSNVMRGDKQSIPLTMEWSTSAPHDLILAGYHDGTVAMWKFSKQSSTQDVKPLLCFSADRVSIRSLAWAPTEGDSESANLIVTAGRGIKFWDIRDLYHPLWEYDPVERDIFSLQWLQNQRCIIMSFDDGFIRTLSLAEVVNDFPATGELLSQTNNVGLRNWRCAPFAIWSCQVSGATDIAAYCTGDGYTRYFKLTNEALEKESECHWEPHNVASSFSWGKQDETTLKIGTQIEEEESSGSGIRDGVSGLFKVAKKTCGGKSKRRRESSEEVEVVFRQLKPKNVPIYRVRWNMNKGSERWLCSGGAAGIVRCQKIEI